MKPYEKALELFNQKATVSPKELEDHVGIGPYASKIVWDLKKRGHTFTVQKNGRNVVSYSLVGATMSVPAVVEPDTKPVAPKSTPSPVVQDNGALVSFSVDRDWDSTDGMSIRDLMR